MRTLHPVLIVVWSPVSATFTPSTSSSPPLPLHRTHITSSDTQWHDINRLLLLSTILKKKKISPGSRRQANTDQGQPNGETTQDQSWHKNQPCQDHKLSSLVSNNNHKTCTGQKDINFMIRLDKNIQLKKTSDGANGKIVYTYNHK